MNIHLVFFVFISRQASLIASDSRASGFFCRYFFGVVEKKAK